MKLKREKLEKVTEEAVRLAGRTLSMLFMTRCPVESEYAAVDSFVREVSELREELGFPQVDPEVFFTGDRPKKKGPLGFQLP